MISVQGTELQDTCTVLSGLSLGLDTLSKVGIVGIKICSISVSDLPFELKKRTKPQ